MTRSCNPCTQFRFCLVGFAVFCFSFAPVCANADLTQQQMQAAFYNALLQFSAYSSGEEGLIVTLPYDGDLTWALSDYLETHSAFPGIASGSKVGDVLGQISYYVREILASQGVSSNDIHRAVALLGSVSNQLDKTEVGSYANTVDSWLEDVVAGLYDETYGTPLLNKIRNFTYTQNSELRVHDQELQNLLLSVLGYLQASVANSSSNFYAVSGAITDQTQDIIDYLDEDPSDTERHAEDAAEDEAEDADESLDETAEDYEYTVPEMSDPEEPSTQAASDISGVEDIDSNLSHSALITLTQGTSSNPNSGIPFLPRMEIDLATTPGTTNFLTQLSTIICVGWDAVFAFLGFLLYYSTYRKVRQMLIATRANSVPSGEPFSLHFDPF